MTISLSNSGQFRKANVTYWQVCKRSKQKPNDENHSNKSAKPNEVILYFHLLNNKKN